MEPRVLKSINGPARIKVKPMDQLLKDPPPNGSTNAKTNKKLEKPNVTPASSSVQVIATTSAAQTITTNTPLTPRNNLNSKHIIPGNKTPTKFTKSPITFKNIAPKPQQQATNATTIQNKNKTLHNPIKAKKTIKRVHVNPFILNSSMTPAEKNIIAKAFALLSSKSPGKVGIVTNNQKTEPNTKTVVKRLLNFTPKTRRVIVKTKSSQSKTSPSPSKDPAIISPGQENTVPQQTKHSLLAKNLLLEEPEAEKSKNIVNKRKETVSTNKQDYFEVPILDKLVLKDLNLATKSTNDKATSRKDNASPTYNTDKQITQNSVQAVKNIDSTKPKAVAVPKPVIIVVSPLKTKATASPLSQNVINPHLKTIVGNQNVADKNTSPIAELMNINKELIVTSIPSSDSHKTNLCITEDNSENTVCLLSDDDEAPVTNDKEITKEKDATESPKVNTNNSVPINATQVPEEPQISKKVRTKITKKRSVANETAKDQDHTSDNKSKTTKKQSKPGPARKKLKTSLDGVTNNQENQATDTIVEENIEPTKTPEADSSIQSFVVSDEEESISDQINEPDDEQPKIIEIPESPEKDMSLCPPTNKLSEGEAKKGSRLNFDVSELCEEGTKITESNAEVIDDSGIDCNAFTKEDTNCMNKQREKGKCKRARRRLVRKKKLESIPYWMKSFEERRLTTDNQIAKALTSIASSLQELTNNLTIKNNERNDSMKEINSTLISLKEIVSLHVESD